MAFIKDPSFYQDDRSKALLADNAAFALRNAVDPISIHPEYEVLEDALIAGIPALIAGEPGTGKTSAVIKAAARHGVYADIVPCNSSMPASALIGKVVFNEHKGIDGDLRETVFRPGPLLLDFVNGGICVLDDGLQLKEGLMTEVMEFAMMPEIYNCVQDGAMYRRHPNFRIVMTGNLGCVGTNKVPEALLDRFRVCINVDRLPQRSFLLIGKSKWPWLTDGFLNYAYDLCSAIMAEAKSCAKKHVPCGIRQLEGLMGTLDGKGLPTIDQFTMRVRTTFINVLSKALLPFDRVEAFATTPVVKSYVQKMYGEYKPSFHARSAPQAQAGAGQPAPQPQKPAPKPSSGADLLNDLASERVAP